MIDKSEMETEMMEDTKEKDMTPCKNTYTKKATETTGEVSKSAPHKQGHITCHTNNHNTTKK